MRESLTEMVEDAVKEMKIRPPSEDHVEQRLVHYLMKYREITKSRAEYIELTALLVGAGALKETEQ